MFPIYPYINVNDLNLDYLLRTIKALEVEVKNFVNFNTIKYADPLEWNITTQYQGNTVVIDNVNHIAYLSTQPVPAGVLLTDTDYWTPILDLRLFYDSIGDLSELDTTAKDTLVNAINEVFTNLQEMIDTRAYVTPEMFGAKGDGIEDDTAAVQAAINSGKPVHIGAEYLVVASDASPWHHGLTLKDNTTIFGLGTIKLAPNNYDNYDILLIEGVANVSIKGVTLLGERTEHTGASGEWGFGINILNSKNVNIEDVKINNCWGDGIILRGDATPVNNENITIENCHVYENRRNNISVTSGKNVIIDGCVIEHANGTAPEQGIDIETDYPATQEIDGVTITGCIFNDNPNGGVAINHFEEGTTKNIIIDGNVFNGPKGVNVYVNRIDREGERDIITNNTFTCDTFAIGGTYANSIVKSNYIKAVSISGSAVDLSGQYAEASENTFTGSASVFIKITARSIAQGNKFLNCSGTTGIEGDSYDQIKDNTFDQPKITNLFKLFGTTKVVIMNNSNESYSAADVQFVISLNTGVTSSDEVISFNSFRYSNSISDGTITHHANILNGTYSA